MADDKFINWSNFRIGSFGPAISSALIIVGIFWWLLEPRLDQRIDAIIDQKMDTYTVSQNQRVMSIKDTLDEIQKIIDQLRLDLTETKTQATATNKSVGRLEDMVDELVMSDRPVRKK